MNNSAYELWKKNTIKQTDTLIEKQKNVCARVCLSNCLSLCVLICVKPVILTDSSFRNKLGSLKAPYNLYKCECSALPVSQTSKCSSEKNRNREAWLDSSSSA